MIVEEKLGGEFMQVNRFGGKITAIIHGNQLNKRQNFQAFR